MGWYSRLMTRYPWVLILIDLLVVATCGPVVYYLHGLPTFDDPIAGFETSGTTIQGRRGAAKLVQDQYYQRNLRYRPSLAGSRKKRETEDCLDEKFAALQGDSPRFMVMESVVPGEDLLTVKNLKAICDVEDKYILQNWPQEQLSSGCRMHSIPYYVARANNKTCSDIVQEDVDWLKNLLTTCAQYYYDKSLSWCYHNITLCHLIPPRCSDYNAVFKMLYFLADKNFMPEVPPGEQPKINKLEYTLLVFRKSWETRNNAMTDFFLDHLDGKEVVSSDRAVISRAFSFGIIFDLFGHYVVMDLPYYALAMGLVLLVIVIYMRSLSLTLVIILTVAFTLIVGYFMYMVVFRFVFFPFMNLLAGLLLIAVGADDVFIIRDIWLKYSYSEDGGKVADIEKIVSKTLSHGALSVFVTSLTTAAALFANYVSAVTVLKCFSIFAGTCILINFIFMITWVPAIMVIMEKAERACPKCTNVCSSQRFTDKLRKASKHVWSYIMPTIVLKLWPLWIILFLAVGIGGAVLVFVTPKLTAPKTDDLILFYDDHPLQLYINDHYQHFQFAVDEEKERLRNHQIRIYWGVKPHDFTSPLNPYDPGRLEYEPTFNAISREGQEWMLEFTNNLLKQPFMPSNHSYINTMELMKGLLAGPCNSSQLRDMSPCCHLSFPLDDSMSEKCYVSQTVYNNMFLIAGSQNKILAGAPIFEKGGLNMVAFSIFVTSNKASSDQFFETQAIYEEIDSWVMGQIEQAPPGLEKGFWCSTPSFEFYDLQKALADGTFIGIGLSLGVGFLVLLVTSLNLLLTTYAIVTICLAILTTTGALVLAGWELGSFESLSITLAVGLSIDFTIHYGIAYKQAEGDNRHDKTKEAISTVGFALAMAALTTFLAGAALMGGTVVGYRNFGVFLMTCMTVSWLFATFLFLPLCRFIGPVGKVGNIVYLLRYPCAKKKAEDVVYDNQISRLQSANNSSGKPQIGVDHTQNNMFLPGYTQAQALRGERPGALPALVPTNSSYYSHRSGVGTVPYTSHVIHSSPYHGGSPASYVESRGHVPIWTAKTNPPYMRSNNISNLPPVTMYSGQDAGRSQQFWY